MPDTIVTTVLSAHGWPVPMTLSEWQWFHGDGRRVIADDEARLAVIWDRHYPEVDPG